MTGLIGYLAIFVRFPEFSRQISWGLTKLDPIKFPLILSLNFHNLRWQQF